MVKITVNSEYFNTRDTLECGQIFRFYPVEQNVYDVVSLDKVARVQTHEDKTEIICNETDQAYFENFFDLKRDYSKIVDSAIKYGNQFLTECATRGKGIRILNQDIVETLFSFIISQNNNIPRIKGILERLCTALGEKKTFLDRQYFAFPSIKAMSSQPLEFYAKLGLGYRAQYVKKLADDINNGLDVATYNNLDTPALKKALTNLYGVGPKVADCVCLFGYHRSDSFPVDTWIEKVYVQNFNGTLKDRNKITAYFNQLFNENAGYYQQYMFYFKRSLQNP